MPLSSDEMHINLGAVRGTVRSYDVHGANDGRLEISIQPPGQLKCHIAARDDASHACSNPGGEHTCEVDFYTLVGDKALCLLTCLPNPLLMAIQRSKSTLSAYKSVQSTSTSDTF